MKKKIIKKIKAGPDGRVKLKLLDNEANAQNCS